MSSKSKKSIWGLLIPLVIIIASGSVLLFQLIASRQVNATLSPGIYQLSDFAVNKEQSFNLSVSSDFLYCVDSAKSKFMLHDEQNKDIKVFYENSSTTQTCFVPATTVVNGRLKILSPSSPTSIDVK